ncbi:MAG TPA: tetratricopeptide repeat protein [Roseiflexaceae bacterium]|nr:tetratricopeptide repeat protein [Roseiflexaceae bacterium]
MEQTSAPAHLRAPTTLPDAGFTENVNSAFKSYHSILALSRSPLANSALVVPALVRDAVSPTADERGHALRLVLQWAVGLLAPEPPAFPLGAPRPYDDPAWRDPRWWRYNILRHRYLEPLHPDEFVEGGRYTETLIALTGIPSADTFFEERNRAIREVSAWLRQQLTGDVAGEALQQMALEETLRPLQRRPAARALLDIAATFEGVFPRSLLIQLAEEERVAGVDAALAYLTAERLLRTDEPGADLWLSPVLQVYLYERQGEELRQRRHRHAARRHVALREPLPAAHHWQLAGQWSAAAQVLFAAAAELVDELQIGELRNALLKFRADQLSTEEWRATQVLLSDLGARLGQREEALAACRAALKAAHTPTQQAQIYRRMGKLYEQHNQLHALNYFHQAVERFPEDDPELVALLKDRAWLHILRREWQSADDDLALALARAPATAREMRADIYDALASLNRDQQRFTQAVDFARNALSLREELGNLPRIADSFNNLGLLYSAIGDYANALAAFHEALATYRKIDNRERTAGALLNIGMVHHLAGRRGEAVAAYADCLAIAVSLELRLITVRAHYNLAEALAEIGDTFTAQQHWSTACQLSLAAGFDDETRDLEALRERFPSLRGPGIAPLAIQPQQTQAQTIADAGERQVLALVARDGWVSPKTLIAELHISKATATRRLADLVRKGQLRPHGKGRATTYLPTSSHPTEPLEADPSTRLESLLREQASRLSERYALSAVGLVRATGVELRLLARFARAPDLHTFFELERVLGQLLGQRVDLLPAEVADTDVEPTQIVWFELKA